VLRVITTSKVRECIEVMLVTRTRKVVITAYGDESKLAIVEGDLSDPLFSFAFLRLSGY
jgi:hypothetical protein